MTKEKSWREQAVDRLETFCGLNPEAIGVGRKIVQSPTPFWKNHADTSELVGVGTGIDLPKVDLK
jgi:hypothetical protein